MYILGTQRVLRCCWAGIAAGWHLSVLVYWYRYRGIGVSVVVAPPVVVI